MKGMSADDRNPGGERWDDVPLEEFLRGVAPDDVEIELRDEPGENGAG